MKVLYDITTLGMGHIHQRARTGVFRVVENIANGLAESNECELEVCTTSNSQLNCCREYLETNPILENLFYNITNYNSKNKLLDWTKLQIQDSQNKIDELSTENKLQILPLLLRKKFASGLRKLENTKIRLAHNKHLITTASKLESNRAIFHSPFYAIPEQFRKLKYGRAFLTCHDLIAIKFPHFFNMGEDNHMKSVFSGINNNTWLICNSQSTKNDLCNYQTLIDPDKVFVTYLAASEYFYPFTNSTKSQIVKKKYGLPENCQYFLCLSTLEPRKNIDLVIRSFVHLIKQEKISDLYLILVGTQGWKYDKIFEDIEKSNELRNRIILTGFVPDEDLAPLYSGALAFVYMSFYEGFGLPPLEAMQCGVPVITSNTSSFPEVVGDAGIMLSPDDGDSLSESMFNFYKNSTLVNLYSKKSLLKAAQFSWGKCVNETLQAYRFSLDG